MHKIDGVEYRKWGTSGGLPLFAMNSYKDRRELSVCLCGGGALDRRDNRSIATATDTLRCKPKAVISSGLSSCATRARTVVQKSKRRRRERRKCSGKNKGNLLLHGTVVMLNRRERPMDAFINGLHMRANPGELLKGHTRPILQ